jgi:CRISPR-associated protein Cas6
MVDILFSLAGKEIPLDHGYELFDALSNLVPSICDDPSIGIHPITGRPLRRGLVALTEYSRLAVRIDADKVAMVMCLSGSEVCLEGHRVMIGEPETRPLVPGARLYSRLVVIKGLTSWKGFLAGVRRNLSDMEIWGLPYLVERRSTYRGGSAGSSETACPYQCCTIKVGDTEARGFAVGVEALSSDESIRLQEGGMGEHRKMGCGVFVPCPPLYSHLDGIGI